MAHCHSRARQELGKLFSRVWNSSGYTLTHYTKRESFYHKADSHLRTFLLNFKPKLSEGKSQWLINGTTSAIYCRHFQTNKSENLKHILNKGLQNQVQQVGRARSGTANEEFEQLVRGWRSHAFKQVLGPHSRSFTSRSFRSPHLTSGRPRINQHELHKRFYYVDQRGVQHFKRRGPLVWVQGSAGGDRQKKLVVVLGILACGSAYIYYNNLQTVPYTHRRHFVLISPSMEKAMGESEFSNVNPKSQLFRMLKQS